mmetsp:Transcript_117657/g.374893  ORF Transcript_117657/g.374893 Transcript_117657/m.374893 type:complete len:323 (+) Transcript_117657:90-1058(+)
MCLGGAKGQQTSGGNGIAQDSAVVQYDENHLDRLLISIEGNYLKNRGKAPLIQDRSQEPAVVDGGGGGRSDPQPEEPSEPDEPEEPASPRPGPQNEVQQELLGKTKLCKFWSRGQCERGPSCTFAHGRTELRSKPTLFRTEMCFDFVKTGACDYGDTCRYAHDLQDIRTPEIPKVVKKRKKSQKHAVEDRAMNHKMETIKHETNCLRAQVRALEKAFSKSSGPDLAASSIQQTTDCAPTPGSSIAEELSEVSSTSNAGEHFIKEIDDADDGSIATDATLVVKNTTFSLVPIGFMKNRRAKSVIRNRKMKDAVWASAGASIKA